MAANDKLQRNNEQLENMDLEKNEIIARLGSWKPAKPSLSTAQAYSFGSGMPVEEDVKTIDLQSTIKQTPAFLPKQSRLPLERMPLE